MHVNAYGMPKQKAGVIIETFEGKAVDWGVITGPTLREGLREYQTGRKLRSIIPQYLTVLFPPRGLLAAAPNQPTPGPRPTKRRLAELAITKWEDKPQPTQTTAQPSQAERRETTTEQEEEPRQETPRPKRRRLDRKDGRGLVKDTTVAMGTTIDNDVSVGIVDAVE